jgi:hypothetical protein
MCEWACQQCREAFWGHPPESGLCTACQQENEQRDQGEACDEH